MYTQIKERFENFLNKAREIHGDFYDYSEALYKNSKTKIKIICPKHGAFWQKPSNHLQKYGCLECGKERIVLSKKLSVEEIIEAFNRKHDGKYSYNFDGYVDLLSKIKITCPIHGDFFQSAKHHLSGHGCNKCGHDVRTSKKRNDYSFDLENKFKLVHGDKYDYSKVNYKSAKEKVSIICPIHGEFEQTPDNHLRGSGDCPDCKMTLIETKIKTFLQDNSIKYIKKCRNTIYPFELDFLLPEKNVAIECNGIYWHSELAGKGRKYHLNKTNACAEKGIRLIHVFEHEITNCERKVFNRLKSILGINKRKIFARKCKIMEISREVRKKFLSKYHMQGDCAAQYNFGLFYKNRLVSVMCFSKLRMGISKNKSDNENAYELIRFSNNFNFVVVGGANKLLKHFERMVNPRRIISYADKRWSDGNVYYKMGFSLIRESQPNYWYFKGLNVYHRFSFRKSVLEKKLENFDKNLSEWQNMKNNNWNRFWDCGTLVFEKSNF